MTDRPSIDVAVVMCRVRIDNRWQPWRWELAEVLPNDAAFGTEPRLLLDHEDEQRWLHPGFRVELFRDDAEGYYLNATTPAPCWFVLWRMEEEASLAAEPIPRPTMVSVSYHDAGGAPIGPQETFQVDVVAGKRSVLSVRSMY